MQKIPIEKLVKVIIHLKLLEAGQKTQKLNKLRFKKLLMKVLSKGMMKNNTQNEALVRIKEVR